jgi:hypothetical protein
MFESPCNVFRAQGAKKDVQLSAVNLPGATAGQALEGWLIERARLLPDLAATASFCAALEGRGLTSPAVRTALRSIEVDADVRVVDGVSFVRARTSRARPVLRTWIQSLPARLGVHFDLRAEVPETTLGRVHRETGVDLSAARVRVHIARARLLELEFFALGSPHQQSEMEDAAQLFTEYALGDLVYERWVGALSLNTVAKRSRSLLVLGDGASKEDFSIFETANLVGAATQAFEPGRALPKPVSDLWYALELPALDAPNPELEPGRLFASTCVPAALKGALEGLPFYSERFFPSGFELVFVAWCRDPSRADARQDVERLVLSLDERTLAVGSGFGATHDFLDALVPAEVALVEALLSGLEVLGLRGRLGFYRTDYHELGLSFGA